MILNSGDLTSDLLGRELMGERHGSFALSFILMGAGPGDGPARHQHPHEEVTVVLEGEIMANACNSQDGGEKERKHPHLAHQPVAVIVTAREGAVMTTDHVAQTFNLNRG